jgi:hypothetical protein
MHLKFELGNALGGLIPPWRGNIVGKETIGEVFFCPGWYTIFEAIAE